MVRKVLNQSGQMAIEMVLLITFFFGFTVFVSSQFQEEGYLAQVVSRPWKSLAGMIQNGVWGSSQETMKYHPNTFGRVRSPEAEEAK